MRILATPVGRMRRIDYATALAVLNLSMIGAAAFSPGADASSTAVRSVLLLPLAWLFYCAMSRRLHDAGRSRTLAVLILAAVVVGDRLHGATAPVAAIGTVALVTASLAGLYVLIAPPSPDAARYGTDPRIGLPTVDPEEGAPA